VGAIFAFYFLVINPVYFHYKNLKTNVIAKNQIKIMSRVDKLTNTEDSVFDGIGMAVSRDKATRYSLTARWANERSNGADYDIIDALRESEPKVWIDNYRMDRLNEDDKQFLSSSFVHDWANVYVAGATISHRALGLTEKRVNLIASATYAVLAADRSKVRIDGRVPNASIYLDAGMHEVTIVGESQELVLKYQPAADNELPPEEPFPLFPSYSE
jgi:hypothetical protein